MARFKEFDEELVIEQAMQLFRQRGYEATSIRDLVAHTGVSSSSLYSTFGDKDAIFMLALQRHSQQELAAFRRQLADSIDPRATIEQLFAGMTEQLLHEEVPYAGRSVNIRYVGALLTAPLSLNSVRSNLHAPRHAPLIRVHFTFRKGGKQSSSRNQKNPA